MEPCATWLGAGLVGDGGAADALVSSDMTVCVDGSAGDDNTGAAGEGWVVARLDDMTAGSTKAAVAGLTIATVLMAGLLAGAEEVVELLAACVVGVEEGCVPEAHAHSEKDR